MTEQEMAQIEQFRHSRRQAELEKLLVQLNWLISATPTGNARNKLTEMDIVAMMLKNEPEFK